jgi:hypothetical protein
VVRVPFPGQQSVFRDGNQALFYLPALGLSRPMDIKVKIFARNPAVSGATATPALSASSWHKILQTRPATVALTAVNPVQLTVAQLEGVRSELTGVLSGGLERELRREQQARGALKAAIRGYRANAKRLHVSRRALVVYLGRSNAGIAHLQAKIGAMNRLISKVDRLVAATTNPPVAVTQTDVGLGQELTSQPGLVTSSIKPQGVPVINVDDRVRYQQFSGLGAALPDSSAWLIYDNLSVPTRRALLQALFGSRGTQNALGVPPIHLNFLRVPIAAGGAMTVAAPYSYDDNPPTGSDPNLAFFSTAHDLPYVVPTLQQALWSQPEPSDPGQPVEPAGVDEEQRVPRQRDRPGRAAPGRLRSAGELLRQVHPGVRDLRHPDRCHHAAERALIGTVPHRVSGDDAA